MAGGSGGRGTGADPSDEFIDHYKDLGLPTGEEGLKKTLKEIKEAYRRESRLRHPDKRKDDPDATADFQRLTASFEVLKDEAKRSVYDAKIRAGLEKAARDAQLGAKRRRLAEDLDERERAAAREAESVDPDELVKKKEKSVAAELKRELEEFQARKAKKVADAFASASGQEKREDNGDVTLDKERVLKVSWERAMGDYGALRLQEIFERFGGVEDVVIRSKGSKKKGSAVIVMSSKDAAAAAIHSMSGDLSNSLLVLPLQPAASSTFPTNSAETVDPKSSNIIGAGFQDYEASILKKLEKETPYPNICMPLVFKKFQECVIKC